MMKLRTKAKQQKERGMALLLSLFALLLLSAIGLFMVLASNTETHIDANYSNGLRSYYAARSGLEEVRDRMKYPSNPTNPTSNGLSDLLPQDVTGNANGVLYVLNPAGGETVDPTDPTSPYFDDQLCHDYNSGVAAKDTKCTALPGTPNWNLPVQYSIAASTQLGYKWIRVNMKTNRIADPYFVDQSGTSVPLDTRVCFDGETEQLSPGGANPSCDANGMQTVYMLTSLAATSQTGGPNGSHKLMRVEVVAPSIRPPGALTLGASTTAPVLINSNSNSAGIPTIAIDGRPHDINGVLSAAPSCSMIAPLATDSPTGTAQLEQSLNSVRKSIVTQANAACYADGSNTLNNICTAGLWWVRGTDLLPRFITTGSSTSPSSTSTSSTSTSSTSTSSSSGSTPGGSGNGRGGRDDDDSHGGHHHNDPSGAPDPSGACAATDPSCFTNLDLAAPELFATSAVTGTDIPVVALPADGIAPFTGGKGNQSDASIYQPASANIIANEIKAVTDFVSSSTSDPSYYTASLATLAVSYGTSTNPAIVFFTDPILSLQNNSVGLSGYGVLVIQNGSLEITNAALNWNGIIVIQSPTGHVTLNSATGSINGALLLQPGAALSLQNSSTASCGPNQLCTSFRLTYSCDAIDLAFTSKPFKIISTQGTSF
jgi:hypothetical protein